MPRQKAFDWTGVEYGSSEYHRLYRLHRGESMRVYKREYDSKRYKTHYKQEHARRAKWKGDNKAKARIHQKVYRALASGALIKLPCEVCKELKSIAHHFDYNQPLNVMWLCELHHKEWHRDNKVVEPLSRKLWSRY